MKKEYKVETYLPIEALEDIRNGLYACGYGKIGDYENCMSWYEINSSWKPIAGANPYQGKVGEIEYAREYKLELRCNEEDVEEVVDIIKSNHPYEEVCINVIAVLVY